MKYKAKKFMSYKRKMTNGGSEFFNIINRPTAFQMKITKNRKRKEK